MPRDVSWRKQCLAFTALNSRSGAIVSNRGEGSHRRVRSARLGRFMRAAFLVLLFALMSVLVLLVTGSACGTTECTPEANGFEGAARLNHRVITQRVETPGDCQRPRVEVIATEDELRTLYDELRVASGDGGADGGPSDHPVVDFSRERVIVRAGPGKQGIAWSVAQGETATLGLAECIGAETTCAIDVVAVPSLVTRAETRVCDALSCGRPLQPPVKRH